MGDETQTLSVRQDAAEGGVVLQPNVIQGRVRFTNQNPEILQMLETDTRRLALVTATSTSPTGYQARSELSNLTSMRNGFDFELSVESSAGGDTGVLYTVAPRWMSRLTPDDAVYSFQPATGVRVRPLHQQPEPAELEFQECAGVVQLQWGTDETCAQPVGVFDAYWGGHYQGRYTSGRLNSFVRGGTSGKTRVVYRVGTSLATDSRTLSRDVEWSAACDEVVKVCIAVPGPGELGALTGPWDIVGEQTLWARLVSIHGGPESNVRQVSASGREVVRAPVSEPSRWWTAPNLVPGPYSSWGRGHLRAGREFTWFNTPTFGPVTAVAGRTLPVSREEAGGPRYPFVMRPAYLHGAIRLADPYVAANPGASSSLEGLFFEADHDSNNDGRPNYTSFFQTDRYSTSLRARVGDGWSSTSFRNAFDTARGELSSSYEQALMSAYDEPRTSTQEMLRLGFWTQGYNRVTRPGAYDPASYRHGWLDLSQKKSPSALLGPGQQHRVDHEYCFNEVQLEYSTAGQRFFNPSVVVSGRLKGTDWRGVAADYTVSGTMWGIPAAVGIPEAEAITHAASSGSVRLALPQGDYTLTPGASFVNDSGKVNTATFRPQQFTLGCGQRLKLVPPLAVNLHPRPSCAASGSVTVSGVVKSSPAEVDRIWYQVGDGPEVTYCTNCGIDPGFSFPVTLQTCGNTVKVFAFTAGLPAPATGFQELVWDDPADGPSCADTTCVNRPPVARCRNVRLPANGACQGNASVDDGSEDFEDGEVTCTQSPAGPHSKGMHAVTLTCTDSQGATASCEATVTVLDETAPTLVCPAVPALECGEGGAVASFAPSAQDACGAVSPVCSPASGTHFSLGSTYVSCSATDGAGNAASCAFPVRVVDTRAPVLTLNGLAALTLRRGVDTYTEQGATASDACQGDLSAQVAISGSVDTEAAGRYTVSYAVADSSGNTATATRVVDVVGEAVCSAAPPTTAWGSTGRMSAPRLLHTATRLAGGKVLIVGGFTWASELYDPATGSWAASGNAIATHREHTATLLPDGRVLVAGGVGSESGDFTEVYEPVTGAWSLTGRMGTARRNHTATLLPDGRVLVVGGRDDGGLLLASAEVYDPATGLWTATGPMRTARLDHAATVLRSGKVLVTGGGDAGGGLLASAEVYDPVTGSWASVSGMGTARRYHTATPLPSGKVLVAGGAGLDVSASATSELYDPVLEGWTSAGSMGQPRRYHTATLLPSGRLLVAGGYHDSTGIHTSAETYDPATGLWCPVARMTVDRYQHTATLLDSGRLLVAGGFSNGDQSSAELYAPDVN
ncbi:kelch repeat-containing protein [Archangium gephyra]|uniref:Branched-chain amino acid ABC transporter, amino acid-binding protein n=1 Tax=Archangium gephyra TaxID=48 RepID=A0AAC8TG82_9BACT|nr:kelch repeat-containing protein [Archangium gephyra]AKJ04590.1 Branched-chain amino acid ABC transporter, amino acid-binding protein [Archangium gephyra]